MNNTLKTVLIVTFIYFIMRFSLKKYLGGNLLEVLISSFIFGIIYYILLNYLNKKIRKPTKTKKHKSKK